VGQAIAEHYMPRSADDGLPVSDPGRALGLAEKIDNICACFALGLVPTGSQDPYALRRQSQAVLRMVREAGRFIRLGELVDAGLALLPDKADKSSEARERILGFLRDRLQQTALDEGIPHDLVQAALAVSPDDVADFWLRLTALVSLAREPVWPALVTVAERTCNISRDAPDGPVDPGLFEYPEESRLWEVYQAQRDEIVGLEERRDYPAACRRFAEVFAEPVHAFFDRVFVNVEDAQVRANRLRLVLAVHRLFGGRVADLSRITTGVTK
jgi:glycyl-tRNA synthetase beta chain